MGFLRRFIQKRGGIPGDLRAELERERLVLLAEGVPATLSAPRRLPTLAAVAISQQRLVVCAAGEPLIDVTWDSGAAEEIELGVPDDGLRLTFDAERVGGQRRGPMELLLKLPDATAVAAAIEQRRRPLEPRRPLRER